MRDGICQLKIGSINFVGSVRSVEVQCVYIKMEGGEVDVRKYRSIIKID